MVGYAYSADYSGNYEYISIKAYNCDDFSFVNSYTGYSLYRVRRSDFKVLYAPDMKLENLNMSYNNMKRITQMLQEEEYKYMYPIVASWQITPTGECNVKHCEDMTSVWPLSPMHISLDKAYYNISHMCFLRPFTGLEASFTISVINEVCYMLGIYVSDLLIDVGGEVFCSQDFADLIYAVFKYDNLKKCFMEFHKYKRSKIKFSKDTLIKRIENINFENTGNAISYGEILAEIKRDCIKKLIDHICVCLQENHSFKRTVTGVRLIVGRSIREVQDFGSEFMTRSNLSRSTDINYLSFDELLNAFTFADSMRDIKKTVIKSRRRHANTNKLVKPAFIYKGKIYKEV